MYTCTLRDRIKIDYTCVVIRYKKLTFEQEMGVSSHSPKNLSVQPVQIKTEYQNAVEVKTDCVSDGVTEAAEIKQCLAVDE